MLYFTRENQEQIYLNNLPNGRVYKQAKNQGTNFNKFIQWISKGFEWLVDKYNETFKGLFICESVFLIEQFKKDYSISNEIFYQTTDEEHQQDVKVLKYLMRGNTAWNFEAIASIYNVNVKVYTGVEYYENLDYGILPYKVPHKLSERFSSLRNVIVIVINTKDTGKDVLPHDVPHKLGTSLKIIKLKKIYDIIKQAQVKIVYFKEDIQGEKIKICKG